MVPNGECVLAYEEIVAESHPLRKKALTGKRTPKRRCGCNGGLGRVWVWW